MAIQVDYIIHVVRIAKICKRQKKKKHDNYLMSMRIISYVLSIIHQSVDKLIEVCICMYIFLCVDIPICSSIYKEHAEGN